MSMALIENGGQIASVDRQNDRFQPNFNQIRPKQARKSGQRVAGGLRRW